MTQEARDALDRSRERSNEPIIQAAQILADAIDRLNVALTGTDKQGDDGTLGWVARALGVIAEVTLEGASAKPRPRRSK